MSRSCHNFMPRVLEATSSLDEKSHVLTLNFDEELVAGTSALLTIDYCGTVNDKMAGFYRSSYTDNESGEKKYSFRIWFLKLFYGLGS